MNFKLLFLSLLFGLILIPTFAQNQDAAPDFITDRPDQTESPYSIPVNFFQVETGFQYTKYNLGYGFKLREYTYNTTLLRYGLLRKLELRLGLDLMDQQINSIPDEMDPKLGFSPLLFGLKYELTKERGWRPKIAVLAQGYFPFIGGEQYGATEIGAELRIAFAHTLSEKSNLSYNLGIEKNDGPDVSYNYTLAYGYNIIDHFTAYAELYGFFQDDGLHYWNAGLTYSLASNIQLDTYAGTGIQNNQDLLLGIGISFRLPK